MLLLFLKTHQGALKITNQGAQLLPMFFTCYMAKDAGISFFFLKLFLFKLFDPDYK